MTPALLQETAREYLRPGNRTVYTIEPGKAAPAKERRTMTRAPDALPWPLAAGLLLLAASPRPAAQQKQAPPPAGTPKDFTLPNPARFTLPNGLAVTMVPFGQVPKVTPAPRGRGRQPVRRARPRSGSRT